MRRIFRAPQGTALLAAIIGTIALPTPGVAQRADHDFLFRTPRASVSMRVGYARPNASSEVFDFTSQRLTVDRNDFAAPSWGGELAVRISPRVDVAFDMSYARSRKLSEFRDWVDSDDLPIQQTTEFKRVPVTAGLKYYLTERGRSIGRFAWIPRSWAPFVGAGAGWVWYSFTQNGDFVDFNTDDLEIYSDRYISDGHTPTVHLFGGADFSLSPNFFLTAEGRYQWAKADMSQDFVGFDRMDLSGFQATAGISVRF